ncbi:hypothetical protein HK102_008723, partial [Quaeritorhiza haematococci]
MATGTEFARYAPNMYGTLVIRPASRDFDIDTDTYQQFMKQVVERYISDYKSPCCDH